MSKWRQYAAAYSGQRGVRYRRAERKCTCVVSRKTGQVSNPCPACKLASERVFGNSPAIHLRQGNPKHAASDALQLAIARVLCGEPLAEAKAAVTAERGNTHSTKVASSVLSAIRIPVSEKNRSVLTAVRSALSASRQSGNTAPLESVSAKRGTTALCGDDSVTMTNGKATRDESRNIANTGARIGGQSSGTRNTDTGK